MIRYWLGHLLGPFLVSSLLIIVLAGKKWRAKLRYLFILGVALAMTAFMKLVPDSPWFVIVMVSVMVGIALRYW